jgi:hypothetical protein
MTRPLRSLGARFEWVRRPAGAFIFSVMPTESRRAALWTPAATTVSSA